MDITVNDPRVVDPNNSKNNPNSQQSSESQQQSQIIFIDPVSSPQSNQPDEDLLQQLAKLKAILAAKDAEIAAKDSIIQQHEARLGQIKPNDDQPDTFPNSQSSIPPIKNTPLISTITPSTTPQSSISGVSNSTRTPQQKLHFTFDQHTSHSTPPPPSSSSSSVSSSAQYSTYDAQNTTNNQNLQTNLYNAIINANNTSNDSSQQLILRPLHMNQLDFNPSHSNQHPDFRQSIAQSVLGDLRGASNNDLLRCSNGSTIPPPPPITEGIQLNYAHNPYNAPYNQPLTPAGGGIGGGMTSGKINKNGGYQSLQPIHNSRTPTNSTTPNPTPTSNHIQDGIYNLERSNVPHQLSQLGPTNSQQRGQNNTQTGTYFQNSQHLSPPSGSTTPCSVTGSSAVIIGNNSAADCPHLALRNNQNYQIGGLGGIASMPVHMAMSDTSSVQTNITNTVPTPTPTNNADLLASPLQNDDQSGHFIPHIGGRGGYIGHFGAQQGQFLGDLTVKRPDSGYTPTNYMVTTSIGGDYTPTNDQTTNHTATQTNVSAITPMTTTDSISPQGGQYIMVDQRRNGNMNASTPQQELHQIQRQSIPPPPPPPITPITHDNCYQASSNTATTSNINNGYQYNGTEVVSPDTPTNHLIRNVSQIPMEVDTTINSQDDMSHSSTNGLPGANHNHNPNIPATKQQQTNTPIYTNATSSIVSNMTSMTTATTIARRQLSTRREPRASVVFPIPDHYVIPPIPPELHVKIHEGETELDLMRRTNQGKPLTPSSNTSPSPNNNLAGQGSATTEKNNYNYHLFDKSSRYHAYQNNNNMNTNPPQANNLQHSASLYLPPSSSQRDTSTSDQQSSSTSLATQLSRMNSTLGQRDLQALANGGKNTTIMASPLGLHTSVSSLQFQIQPHSTRGGLSTVNYALPDAQGKQAILDGRTGVMVGRTEETQTIAKASGRRASIMGGSPLPPPPNLTSHYNNTQTGQTGHTTGLTINTGDYNSASDFYSQMSPTSVNNNYHQSQAMGQPTLSRVNSRRASLSLHPMSPFGQSATAQAAAQAASSVNNPNGGTSFIGRQYSSHNGSVAAGSIRGGGQQPTTPTSSHFTNQNASQPPIPNHARSPSSTQYETVKIHYAPATPSLPTYTACTIAKAPLHPASRPSSSASSSTLLTTAPTNLTHTTAIGRIESQTIRINPPNNIAPPGQIIATLSPTTLHPTMSNDTKSANNNNSRGNNASLPPPPPPQTSAITTHSPPPIPQAAFMRTSSTTSSRAPPPIPAHLRGGAATISSTTSIDNQSQQNGPQNGHFSTEHQSLSIQINITGNNPNNNSQEGHTTSPTTSLATTQLQRSSSNIGQHSISTTFSPGAADYNNRARYVTGAGRRASLATAGHQTFSQQQFLAAMNSQQLPK